MALNEIEFEGNVYLYDPKEAMNYRNIKRLAHSTTDPAAFFDVSEAIFAGKDEEYADQLGSFDKFQDLVSAIFEKHGRKAKN